MADRAFDRLAEHGPALRLPHARPPGGGLSELRFAGEATARRVTCYTDTRAKVITVTTFGKQRQNERREVARARQAMRASQQAGGSDG
jgi:hypothetical protein